MNILGLILSGLFLYLCFRSLDAETLKQVFHMKNPVLLLAVIPLNFLLIAVRNWVWLKLLQPLQKLPFQKVFQILNIGYMANNLLPLKAGEFFRASYIAKKWSLPYAQVLTTVGLERYFSGLSLLLIFLGVTWFLPIPLWLKSGAYVMAAVLLAVQVTVIILSKKKNTLARYKDRKAWRYRILQFLHDISEASQSLRSLNSFTTLTLLSIMTWILQALMLQLVAFAFEVPLSFSGSCFVMVAINLAIALPSAPSSLGTFEYAALLSLNWLGIERAQALGIGIYFHLLQIIPVTLLGLFYYFRWGMKIKDRPPETLTQKISK